MKNILFVLLVLWMAVNVTAQQDTATAKLRVDGRLYTALITPEGDTLILADLDEINISSMRSFASDEDYQKYMRFRRHAFTVYPYAKEAIRIFREYEYAKEKLSKRDAKKKLKTLEKELTQEFEEPLKGLTKLQGKIMFKMIEKELDQTMYDLLKGVKGTFTAFYWHNFSKLYDYNLKEGYEPGKYEILDAVLTDFDVSHRIDKGTSLKYITLDDVKKKRR